MLRLPTALGRMVPTVVRAVMGMNVGARTLLRGARTALAWLHCVLLCFPLLVVLGRWAPRLKQKVLWWFGPFGLVLCGRLTRPLDIVAVVPRALRVALADDLARSATWNTPRDSGDLRKRRKERDWRNENKEDAESVTKAMTVPRRDP